MRHWLDFLFRRDRVERELDDELRAGFDLTVERYVARGMSPADARRAARADFAGAKEQTRDALRGHPCREICNIQPRLAIIVSARGTIHRIG